MNRRVKINKKVKFNRKIFQNSVRVVYLIAATILTFTQLQVVSILTSSGPGYLQMNLDNGLHAMLPSPSHLNFSELTVNL